LRLVYILLRYGTETKRGAIDGLPVVALVAKDGNGGIHREHFAMVHVA